MLLEWYVSEDTLSSTNYFTVSEDFVAYLLI